MLIFPTFMLGAPTPLPLPYIGTTSGTLTPRQVGAVVGDYAYATGGNKLVSGSGGSWNRPINAKGLFYKQLVAADLDSICGNQNSSSDTRTYAAYFKGVSASNSGGQGNYGGSSTQGTLSGYAKDSKWNGMLVLLTETVDTGNTPQVFLQNAAATQFTSLYTSNPLLPGGPAGTGADSNGPLILFYYNNPPQPVYVGDNITYTAGKPGTGQSVYGEVGILSNV